MKKVKKILKISIMVVALAVGFIGLPALADDKACTIDPNNPACNGDGDFFKTFDSVMNAVMAIVGVIATIVIIVAGVMMATSQGDPGKVKKSKNAIIYAVIGLVVTLAAWAIVNFVVGSV